MKTPKRESPSAGQPMDTRLREYASMLAMVAGNSATTLEEVRLPLHILLENRFGELNENQEEMLGAARAAAESIDGDLVALRQIAELDLGQRELRQDRLLPADLIRSLIPTFQAIAEQRRATLKVEIEPLLPTIRGDQPQIQDALVTILGEAVRAVAPGTEIHLSAAREREFVRIELRNGGSPSPTIRSALAARILAASAGSLEVGGGALILTFIHRP